MLRAKTLVWMTVLALGLPLGGQAHEKTDKATEALKVCAGFVVLPNGYAILSAMPADAQPGEHAGHHAAPAAAHTHGQPPAAPQQATTAALMGYHHGQDIVPQDGMTCVPIANPESNAWMAISAEPNMVVLARSLKGSLAHNSRANEAVALQIVLDGKIVEQAQVRLLARMPHHDHRMPGGHGPANDPDVQGLEARYDATQGYVIPSVDFSMSGPWLFEIQVQQDKATHKAYFASEIAEE